MVLIGSPWNNFTIGITSERRNYSSIKFIYKNNRKKYKPEYKYKKSEFKDTDNKYAKLIKSIESNGIGVKKIIETPEAIGLELTQFHSSQSGYSRRYNKKRLI